MDNQMKLTADEREFLREVRRLDEEGRRLLLETAVELAEAERKALLSESEKQSLTNLI